MSIETLEQKKVLLPYLEKIEYINYQLQCVQPFTISNAHSRLFKATIY